jgi:hypothetical protein
MDGGVESCLGLLTVEKDGELFLKEEGDKKKIGPR